MFSNKTLKMVNHIRPLLLNNSVNQFPKLMPFVHSVNIRDYSSTNSLTLNIDQSCVQRLKDITGHQEFLRVFVEGGGCSGFQYKFEFDTNIDNDEDMIFEKDGVKVVADEESVKLLNGATVEYHTDLIRAGFRVSNIPNAEKGCSCGVSFSVKL